MGWSQAQQHQAHWSVWLVFMSQQCLSERSLHQSQSLPPSLTCNADRWASIKNEINPSFVYFLLCWSPFLWMGLNQDTIHGENTKRNWSFLWNNAETILLTASARTNTAEKQMKQISREPETDKWAMDGPEHLALVSMHLQQKQQENLELGPPMKKHQKLQEKY